MPTVITVPIGQRDKSVKFGAAYSPSLSFNPDKKLLVGCSGILNGMGVTVNTGPVPAEITVDPGAFIQRGIIVDVTSSQLVQFPGVPTFPLFLVAENANEVFNSSVQYLFTTVPAADSCIIAQWPVGPITAPEIPTHISNCGLADAITAVGNLVIQHDRQVAAFAQTIFTLPGPKAYVVGSNKLQVYRNGKKLVVNDEYAENTATQFTLFTASLAGDIVDILVIQGSPPITSIALNNLTDVTSDLANAIKDPSILRTALATQANPLASLADIAIAIGGLEDVKISVSQFTGGLVTTSSLVFILIDSLPGFTVPVGKTRTMAVIVSATVDGSVGGPNVQLGVQVDGNPAVPMAGVDSTTIMPHVGITGVAIFSGIPAGGHLLHVAMRRLFTLSASGSLYRDATFPVNVITIFKDV